VRRVPRTVHLSHPTGLPTDAHFVGFLDWAISVGRAPQGIPGAFGFSVLQPVPRPTSQPIEVRDLEDATVGLPVVTLGHRRGHGVSVPGCIATALSCADAVCTTPARRAPVGALRVTRTAHEADASTSD
jgi:hypothetical protein